MLMFRFSIVFFLLISTFCNAQDTLVLITGKIIPVKSVDLSDYTITYRTIDGTKLKTIDPARVFSIKYANGAERVIFQTDSLDPIDFSEDEMRRFIKGEQDAREFYRNNTVRYTSLLVGGVSSLGAIYGLPGPLLYATVIGGYSPNLKKRLSFDLSGNALEKAGLSSGKILNSSTGNVQNPVFEKNSELKIERKKFIFAENTTLDSAVSMINSDFKKHRVHAINQNNQLKLFRSSDDRNLDDEIYREGFEKRSRDYKIRNALIGGLIGYVVGGITLTVIFNN
ncbi:MAG: hypothetical protein IPN61_15850 [Bacteroidetes bacterium]|nr:hypothetical protein [Bacteroidota bacterium]MBP6656606.1 hypothetical protein [Bacteroidia bacterium]